MVGAQVTSVDWWIGMHLAEHNMPAIKPGTWRKGDDELGAVCVGFA